MLNDPTRPDTLDDVALPEQEVKPWGWQSIVLVILLWLVVGLCAGSMISLYGQDVFAGWPPDPDQDRYTLLMLALILLGGLAGQAAIFLIVRKQIGWVIALFLTSLTFVLTVFSLGWLLSGVPGPGLTFLEKSGIIDYLIGVILLAGFMLYLITTQPVRLALRIPGSWINRVLSFGGLAGAAIGMLLLWLF